jgi:hypothetical protein
MMNFTPFGGHFPTAIPSIHQFAAKFSQENNSTSLCPTQENNSNRYTANGVPSFTQHHPPTQQQMINTTKYQTNYMNQSIYGHQSSVRQEKRQGYEHQELAQELCAAMLQQNQNQQQDKQTNDKVSRDCCTARVSRGFPDKTRISRERETQPAEPAATSTTASPVESAAEPHGDFDAFDLAVASDTWLDRSGLLVSPPGVDVAAEPPPLPQVFRRVHQERKCPTVGAAHRAQLEPAPHQPPERKRFGVESVERELEQPRDELDEQPPHDQHCPDPEHPAEEEEEEKTGEREEAAAQARRDPSDHCSGRLHAVLLPRVPHGVPGEGASGAAPGGAHARAQICL